MLSSSAESNKSVLHLLLNFARTGMKALHVLSLFFLVWPSTSFPVRTVHLNQHISDFELLHYNKSTLLASHQRVVQGLATGLNFSFQAFGRTLDLSLFPEKEFFSSTPTVHYSDGSVQDVDVSHLYQGTVRGVPGSSVHLSVLDGQAEGSMVLPREATYYMEPVKCPFSRLPSDTLDHDRTQAAETNEGNSQANPACSAEDCLKLHELVSLSSCDASSSVYGSCSVVRKMTFPEKWISCKESGIPARSTFSGNNVCNLHMYADPTFWRYFKYERFGKLLTDERASTQINRFFAVHVYALKRIFVETEFTTYDGREMFRGIDFEMDRSTIMTDTTENCCTLRPSMLCSPHLTEDQLRSVITSMNHDEYCLAIFFTYRDFDGHFGETEEPTSSRPGTGMCGRYMLRLTNKGTAYQSGNVIWVTLVGGKITLSDEESQLLLAHEVGHALGSPHDDGPDCVPGADSPAGNYLMYKESTNFKANSEKFSSCSKDNITCFLSSVINGIHGRRNCLKRSVRGGGLLHRFVSPDISSEDQDDSKFSTYSRQPDDEL